MNTRWMSRLTTAVTVLSLFIAGCGGGVGQTSPSSPPSLPPPPTVAPGTQISIVGNKLYDSGGVQIIARGPEVVGGDVIGVDRIATLGANAMRILLVLDKANGLTPEYYDAVLAEAAKKKMLVWVSLFVWDNANNYAIGDAFGGGNFYELTAPAGTGTCSPTTPNSCYLAVWNRPWLKSLVDKYRANVIIDAMQEYKGTGDTTLDPARQRWADAAKSFVKYFRSAGFTQPLEIMSSFEGRDLAAIVQHGDEIRAVDTFKVDGNPQTMFGWQAYWTGGWYESWQGELLLGKGQSIFAKDAIHQILPTLAFPVQAGFDNIITDTNVQYAAQIDQAAVDGISWLWWSWKNNLVVDCPVSGNECVDFVQNSINGFKGAKPLSK